MSLRHSEGNVFNSESHARSADAASPGGVTPPRSRRFPIFKVQVHLVLKKPNVIAAVSHATNAPTPAENCAPVLQASLNQNGGKDNGCGPEAPCVCNFEVDESSTVNNLMGMCHSKFSLHCHLPLLESFSLCEYSEYDSEGGIPVASIVQSRNSKVHWRAINCTFIFMENGALLTECPGFKTPTLTSAPPYLHSPPTSTEQPEESSPHLIRSSTNKPSYSTVPLASESISLQLHRKSMIFSSSHTSITSRASGTRAIRQSLPPSQSFLPTRAQTLVVSSPIQSNSQAHLTQSTPIPSSSTPSPISLPPSLLLKTGDYIIQTPNLWYLSCGLASKGEVTLVNSLCSSELWHVAVTIKKVKTEDQIYISLQGYLQLWLRAQKSMHYPLCDRKTQGLFETFKAIPDSSSTYAIRTDSGFLSVDSERLICDSSKPILFKFTFMPRPPTPTVSDAFINITIDADYLEKLHRLEEAISYYDLALTKIDQNNPQIRDVNLRKSRLFRLLGKNALALECVQIYNKTGADVNVHVCFALALRDCKKHGAAITEFESALKSAPGDQALQICKTAELVQIGSGNPASLWDRVNVAIPPQKSRKFLVSAHDCGISLSLCGRHPDALNWFDYQLSLTPGNPFTLLKKAIALRLLSKMDEALKCVEQALEIRPRDPDLLHEKGVLFSFAKRYEDAIKSFDLSLQLRPQYADTLDERRLAKSALEQSQASLPDSRPEKIPSTRAHHPAWALSIVLEQEALFKSHVKSQHFAAVIAVVGYSGTGKSSIINATAEREVTWAGAGKPITIEPSRHVIDSTLVLYETPGTERNPAEELPVILSKLFDLASKQEPPEEIHMVWWVISAADNRIIPKTVLGVCQQYLLRPNGTRIPVILVVNKFVPNEAGNTLKTAIEGDESRDFFWSVVYTNAVPDINFVSTVYLCPKCHTTRLCSQSKENKVKWHFCCQDCGVTSTQDVKPYNISVLKEATIGILPDVVKSSMKLQRMRDIKTTYMQTVNLIIGWTPTIGVMNVAQFEEKLSQYLVEIAKLFGVKNFSSKDDLTSMDFDIPSVFSQYLGLYETYSPVVCILSLCLLWATLLKRCQELLIGSGPTFGFRMGDIIENLSLVNHLFLHVKPKVALFLQNRELSNNVSEHSVEQLANEVCVEVEKALIPEKFRDISLSGVAQGGEKPTIQHLNVSDEAFVEQTLEACFSSTLEITPEDLVGLVMIQPTEQPAASLSTFLKFCLKMVQTAEMHKVERVLCFLKEWITLIPDDFRDSQAAECLRSILAISTERHFGVKAIYDILKEITGTNSSPVLSTQSPEGFLQVTCKKLPAVLAPQYYVASQWSYVDYYLYTQVAKNPRSFISELSPAREALETRIEQEEMWTITQVLSAPPENRIEAIKACVDLGLTLLRMQNFQGACAVASAFSSPILRPLVVPHASEFVDVGRKMISEDLDKLWMQCDTGNNNAYPNLPPLSNSCIPPIKKLYTKYLSSKSLSLSKPVRYSLLRGLALEIFKYQSTNMIIYEFPEMSVGIQNLIPLIHLSFSELENRASESYIAVRLESGLGNHYLFGSRLSVCVQDIFESPSVNALVKQFCSSVCTFINMKVMKDKLVYTTARVTELCLKSLDIGDAVTEDTIKKIVRAEILVRAYLDIFPWCQGLVIEDAEPPIKCAEADAIALIKRSKMKVQKPSDFGLEADYWLGPSSATVTTLNPFQTAIDAFCSIKGKACPTEKAMCVTQTAHEIVSYVDSLWKNAPKGKKIIMTGDAMAAAFTYVLVQSNVPLIFTELFIAQHLGCNSGEHEYYLTTAMMAAMSLYLT
ncbi:hypothetical protein Pelo_15447 [Pelomyxa schiedti]|nr:hypothetical protein Pelo_15447 [Pelomyxa schiedti]